MRTLDLAVGERLFSQGDFGASMHVLARGRLVVLVRDSHGRDNAVSQVRPGDCVGEMTFLDPQPRSASVVASEPATVLELDRHLLAFLRRDVPHAAAAIVSGILAQLGARLRDTNRLIEAQLARIGQGQEGAAGPIPREPPGPRPVPEHGHIDLSAIPLLRDPDAGALASLRRLAPAMRWEDHAVLCHEGDPGGSCFLVVSGQVDVLRYLRGRARRLATLNPGALVGQLALVDRAPRSATVRARGRVVAMELSRVDFERQLMVASPLALRLQEEIAVAGIRQLRLANERCVQIFDRAKSAWGQAPAPAPTAAPAQPLPARPTPRGPVGPVVEITDPLAFMQTALNEWGLSMADLDKMEVVGADGLMSAAEIAARRKRL
ncbi:MAG: cyclic nucleotide-binding domain-containing protein [Pseudomonadota bacterium]